MDRRSFLVDSSRIGGAMAIAAVVPEAAGSPSHTDRGAGTRALLSGSPSPAHSGGDDEAGVTGLTVNDSTMPVGIDPDEAFFAWRLTDRRRGAAQDAYRVRVETAEGPSRRAWDSGAVRSAQQSFVPYGGPRLAADTAYRFSVSVVSFGGRWGPWSSSSFVTGLRESDWRARWLRPGGAEPAPETYRYLRKVVQVSGRPIARATAYVAGAHKYQLWVNEVMAEAGPSFSFPDESYYQATDITRLLHPDRPNVLGFLHHWYGAGSGRPASMPALMAQVSIHYGDGSAVVVGTDGSWRERAAEWLPGPLRNDSSGERVEILDGRAEPLGWVRPDYDDRGWQPPVVLGPPGTPPFTTLAAQRTRIVEHPARPVDVRTLASGAVVADFGRVYAARPSVLFHRGRAGRRMEMRVGYLLDPDGQVSTEHGTQGTDLSFVYVQRDGEQRFVPYTFLGFRYLQIDHPGEPIGGDQLVALLRHAELPERRPATFSSSEPTLDAVWDLCTHSALYSAHEQFLDTPTRQKGQFVSDSCNESQATMRAYGEVNLSWQALRDFARSQARFWPDGRINDCYPDGNGAEDIPDFTELYPEWLWRYATMSGDRQALVRWYPVVRAIAGYLEAAIDSSTGLVTSLPGGGTDYQGGLVDWPLPSRYGYDMATTARTTVNVLAWNAFVRAAQVAEAVNDPAGSLLNEARARALREAVNTRLMGPGGVYIDGLEADGSPSRHASQQANALALAYGIVPDGADERIGSYVVGLGMATGPDHGMELLRGLHRAGLDAAAVKMLTDRRQLGWARLLARGGTFTWEDWEPLDIEGDSMSHGWGASALVAMQEGLLGVTCVPSPTPGTVAVEVAPPAGGLRHASGTVPTVAGPLVVAWTRRRRTLSVRTVVPANASASVTLPAGEGRVTEGGRPLPQAPGVTVETSRPGLTTVRVRGGSYSWKAVQA